MVVCQVNLSKCLLFMRKLVVFAVKNSVEMVKTIPCFSTIRYKWTSCDLFG